MNIIAKQSMLMQARAAASCLQNAQGYLVRAKRELNEGISINNRCFKEEKVEHINSGISEQIQAVNGLISAIMAAQVDE